MLRIMTILADSACMHAKSLQSCLTLYDPMVYSPPGSSVHVFSRQEYWSRLPCPPPGGLPNPGSIPGLGRSSGEGHGSPLQYSCLENPLDRGVW